MLQRHFATKDEVICHCHYPLSGFAGTLHYDILFISTATKETEFDMTYNTYNVTLTSGLTRMEVAPSANAAGRYAMSQSCVFGDKVKNVEFVCEGD